MNIIIVTENLELMAAIHAQLPQLVQQGAQRLTLLNPSKTPISLYFVTDRQEFNATRALLSVPNIEPYTLLSFDGMLTENFKCSEGVLKDIQSDRIHAMLEFPSTDEPAQWQKKVFNFCAALISPIPVSISLQMVQVHCELMQAQHAVTDLKQQKSLQFEISDSMQTLDHASYESLQDHFADLELQLIFAESRVRELGAELRQLKESAKQATELTALKIATTHKVEDENTAVTIPSSEHEKRQRVHSTSDYKSVFFATRPRAAFASENSAFTPVIPGSTLDSGN